MQHLKSLRYETFDVSKMTQPKKSGEVATPLPLIF
jgi:hypothetical protein